VEDGQTIEILPASGGDFEIRPVTQAAAVN